VSLVVRFSLTPGRRGNSPFVTRLRSKISPGPTDRGSGWQLLRRRRLSAVAGGRGALSLLLVLGSLLGTMGLGESPALATNAEDTLAAALKKFDAGRKAFDAGAFEEALLAFQGSYSLSPSPNSRLYIARCFRALGKVASAYTTYRFAAREAQDRLNTTAEKRYAATRDAANAEAGELEAKVPRLTIAVPGDMPVGFVVKRDGAELTSAAWGVAVETDPGSFEVEASGPRLAPFRQAVTLAEGQQLRVDVKITRLPTATLGLRFKTRPAGLAVTLDGTPLEAFAADSPRELDVGRHVLSVSAPGYASFRWEKTLGNGEAAVIDVELAADARAITGGARGTSKWLFFAVAGTAAASLATASVIAVHASGQERAELAKDPFSRSSTTRDSIRAEATTANVLFVAGGVLGIGAAVLGFTTQWRTERPPATSFAIEPWFAPSGAGVGTHGSF
jgi:hypothetical protein